MKFKLSLVLSLISVFTVFDVSAQGKKPIVKPKPTPVAAMSSTPKQETVPTQKVIVEKTNGDRITGLFVAGSSEKITVRVSEANIDVPFAEIASLKVNDVTKPLSIPAPPAEPTTLSIEAAVIYKTGGAQPLARAEMVLLDKSLSSILSEAGLQAERNMDYPTQFGFAVKFPSQYVAFSQKAVAAITPHKVQGFTTDFQGKAFVPEIKEGTYWVLCYYQTRGGFAVWDLPITVRKGSNYIVMDQNNAAVSF